MISFEEIEKFLIEAPSDFWPHAKRISQHGQDLVHNLEWWNVKCYLRQDDNDGSKPQYDARHGVEDEIPIEREYFWPSPEGRLALRSASVAYFGVSSDISTFEVVPFFTKTGEVRWKDVLSWHRGETDPNPEEYSYPLNFSISREAVILDLYHRPENVFSSLGTDRSSRIIDILLSRGKDARLATQAIAEVAHRNGFDGILFRSVWSPIDINTPDSNLVMFTKSFVSRWMPT